MSIVPNVVQFWQLTWSGIGTPPSSNGSKGELKNRLDTSKLQDVAVAEPVGVVVLKDSNCDRLVIVRGGIRLLSAS